MVSGAAVFCSEDDLVNGAYAQGKTKDNNVWFSDAIHTTAFVEK